jgi:nucleoside-diphosphate-sugar epimerase
MGEQQAPARALERVVVLGSGYAGTAIARLARELGATVLAHARSGPRADALRAGGLDVWQRGVLDASVADVIDARTHVVVAFPPDGETDAPIAPSLGCAGLVYLSSTGVYGEHRGVVDDATPVADGAALDEPLRLRLAAEDAYRRAGAIVLRCPAIYGPDRGLHVRVIEGKHRIPGDGTRFISRIHVEDLAALVLAALASRLGGPARPDTFVVGDLAPAPQVEVVRFIVDAYRVPAPPFVPLESVHASLRADRRIDPGRALATFGVRLRYPTYREGMAPSATGIPRLA